MPAALGIIHGIDYLSFHLLFGSVVFRLIILTAGGPETVRRFDYDRALSLIAAAAALSSLSWMIAASADMTESWSPTALWNAMSQTTFGHLWCARVVVLVVIASSFAKFSRHLWYLVLLGIVFLILPLASSLTGHAGTQETTSALNVGTIWAHSVAVGIWSGGLFSLYQWLDTCLKETKRDAKSTHRVVERFSHFAMASTGIIGLTGLATAYQLGVSPWRPWESTYGQILLLKTALFVCALGAAAINQFIHLRKWNESDDVKSVLALKREVRLEIVLVVLVFGVVGFLTRAMLPGK